jgi:cytochrome oxidase assembly protein ShyY1
MHYCKTEASQTCNLSMTQKGKALIPSLLAILTVIAACAAVWQWQRNQFHERLAFAASQQQQKARDLNREPQSTQKHVTVMGQWLADSTVFIAPRIIDGRMGALAVSVLSYQDVSNTRRYIAVNRGWAPQTQINQAPVLLPLPFESVTLTGDLIAALPKAFELKAATPTSLGVWQNHDVSRHAALLKRELEPHILQLTLASADADSRQLRRVSSQQAIQALEQKAASNRGYAVQWLGLTLVGLFGLVWMWRSRFNSKSK